MKSLTFAVSFLLSAPAFAAPSAQCAGVAQAGGAQLLCSNASRPPVAQSCTFRWTLQTMSGAPRVVDGAFQLPGGVQNANVYQATGFALALTPPVILCQPVR